MKVERMILGDGSRSDPYIRFENDAERERYKNVSDEYLAWIGESFLVEKVMIEAIKYLWSRES